MYPTTTTTTIRARVTSTRCARHKVFSSPSRAVKYSTIDTLMVFRFYPANVYPPESLGWLLR